MDIEYSIRKARVDDIESIAAIEKTSNSIPWSKKSILKDIENPNRAIVLVAANSSKLLAYLDAWITPWEASLCNIAVIKEYRRNHIGEHLLRELILNLSSIGINTLTLEVRSQNPAINLYRRLGFEQVGLRKSYYLDDGDDAVLMDLHIGDNSDIK